MRQTMLYYICTKYRKPEEKVKYISNIPNLHYLHTVCCKKKCLNDLK